MKIQKLLIIGMLAAAFSGLSVGASQALSCAVGFEPKDGESMTECVLIEPIAITATDGEDIDPVATTYSEETPPIADNGCWTNTDADGNETNVCARSAVPGPAGTDGCYSAVDENGVCPDVMYSTLPAETDGGLGTPGDVQLLDENGVPIMDKVNPIMFSSSLASGQLPVDKTSNLLAALGVLVAAAGAFGIGLSKERAAKK